MNPYYINDKSITKEFAQELLDCLFVKFNDKNKAVSYTHPRAHETG